MYKHGAPLNIDLRNHEPLVESLCDQKIFLRKGSKGQHRCAWLGTPITAPVPQSSRKAIMGRISAADALLSVRWLQVGVVAASRPAFSSPFCM
jgi:hypothetical protein